MYMPLEDVLLNEAVGMVFFIYTNLKPFPRQGKCNSSIGLNVSFFNCNFY